MPSVFPGWSHNHDWVLKRTLQRLPFWIKYLEEARLLSGFLNNESYREVIVKNLRAVWASTTGELEWSLDDVSFHANFAHWRFGTMARVSKMLRKARPWVVAGFKRELFHCKEAGKLEKVAAIIGDLSFWPKNSIVHAVSSLNEDARTPGRT